MREEVVQAKTRSGSSELITLAGINVSFSQRGLDKLLNNADAKDEAFKEGQLPRAESLGDDLKKWLPEFKTNSIDGLFEVTGYPETHLQSVVGEKIKNSLQVRDREPAITVIYEHYGKVRPGESKGHEHFGFNDGISQPFVKFEDDPVQRRAKFPGQTVVNPGVIVLGQPGDTAPRPPWAKNGSFLAYRHLKQLVPEFNTFLKGVVLSSIFGTLETGSKDSEDLEKRVDFLGARLMGRWKSGLPVVLTPMEGGRFPEDNPTIGKDPQRNNDFNYGPREESPRKQFLCPYAAHTRKTGPRTDISQKDEEEHMIHRGGITYGPELSAGEEHETIHERGLSFVSYQSSLPAGFEFIQKNWSNNETFPFNTGTVSPGFDPIVGQKQGQARKMTGYDAEDLPKALSIPMEFVIAQGGEYFFLPSMTTLGRIANPIY
jgi:Dyp-type peroxidase family